MMILVAFCAVSVAVYRLKRLSDDYRSKAAYAKSAEDRFRMLHTMQVELAKAEAARVDALRRDKALDRLALSLSPEMANKPKEIRQVAETMLASTNAGVKDSARFLAYFKQLRPKYERGARYPWLPVPPDPPEPK
jgi:hypothetical protein